MPFVRSVPLKIGVDLVVVDVWEAACREKCGNLRVHAPRCARPNAR